MDKVTILCVDDEQRILNSLKMLLKREYNVLTTTDGFEALKLLKSHQVHVLISDQRMPIMPGIALLKQACQISPNTTRILLTGYSDLNAVVGSINEGGIYRFLNKPWDNDAVKNIIKEAVSIANNLFLVSPKGTVVATPEPLAKADIVTATDDINMGLIVLDRDKQTEKLLRKTNAGKHCNIFKAISVDEALTVLDQYSIGMMVVDINLGKEEVIEFIHLLKVEHPMILTIIVTELMDFSSIVKLINEGQVFRYLPKPVSVTRLEVPILMAIEKFNECQQNPQLLKKHKVARSDTKDSAAKKSSLSERIGKRLRSLGQRLGYK